jgi:hypothetical protein
MVDLPAPVAPTSATVWPAGMRQLDVLKRQHLPILGDGSVLAVA